MSRFTLCNCPAGFAADPERHAPDCPGRSGAGKPARISRERFQDLMGSQKPGAATPAELERDQLAIANKILIGLLERCQERLHPHRDAALWSDVCAALGPKP